MIVKPYQYIDFIIQQYSIDFNTERKIITERRILKMDNKNVHKIMISGVGLDLSSGNDTEYVEKLADELTRRINKLEFSQLGVSKLEAALVCALDLLDENYRLKLHIEDIGNEGK